MDFSKYEDEVLSGPSDEYVNSIVLEFIKNDVDFEVIDRSAMDLSDVNQDTLIRVVFTEHAENYSDEKLIDMTRERLVDGQRDIQKYQLRTEEGEAINKLQVWRHRSGYSVLGIRE